MLSIRIVPAMHIFCSWSRLVSRITALISAIARVTALVSAIARVTTALASTLVLLVVVVGGIVLRVTFHLLTVVEVLAFSLDELIGFTACESGKEVFGHGVVFGDTYGLGNVSVVLRVGNGLGVGQGVRELKRR